MANHLDRERQTNERSLIVLKEVTFLRGGVALFFYRPYIVIVEIFFPYIVIVETDFSLCPLLQS